MKKLKPFLLPCLCLLTLSITSCGENKNSPLSNQMDQITSNAVVSGNVVSSKNKTGKSIVAILSEQEEGKTLCTGSIIGANTILTAAHCVENNPKNMKIIFGIDIHKTNEDFVRKADKFMIQPNWNLHLRTGEADLALIHFNGAIPLGFLPVNLANDKFKLENGKKVILAGFGVTDGENNIGAGILRQTKSEIIDFRSDTEAVTDGQKSSVCFGDSGGPAFVKVKNELIQWGVASSVANRACNESSIHTEVMKYLSWISKSMAKLQAVNHNSK